MKFSQVLIALTLGLVIFTGVFMSESARQENFKTLENPFEETSSLEEVIILGEEDEALTVFSHNRSLWTFYPDSYSRFDEGQREIANGKVFASFNFITEADLAQARYFATENFDPAEFSPLAAQVKVGQMGINAPGASFFVDRDNTAARTIVYTYDHAIDIWFPGASNPFVIPPQNQITVSDKVVGRLGKLYYTKLKKDLRLKRFDRSEVNIITEALSVKNEKLEAIKDFAKGLPSTWYWFDPGSFMGKVTGIIKYLQRDYALGISQPLRQKYSFDSLLAPFLSAHHRYLNNQDVSESRSQIDDFLEVLGSNRWQAFLIDHPQLANRWNFLGQNQKVWLHHSFQDDPEYIFAPVWFSGGRATSLQDLEKSFFEVEEMMANQFTSKAKLGLKNLTETLSKIELEPADAPRVTRVRRLLNELIEQEISLQIEDVFGLLQQIVTLEVDLYPDTAPVKQEIVLENAQNVLRFLKKFIEDRTAGKINQTLVNTYSFLKIDQIEEQLGRTIFNQAEKETIRLVQFVRAEELTESELNQIQENKSLQDLIDERFAELEANEAEAEEAVFSSNTIDTEEKFADLLKEAGVLTEGLRLELQGSSSNPSYSFRGAYYGKYALNGVFRIDRQEFGFIKLQDIQEKFVDPRYLSSILRRMEKDFEDQAVPEVIENTRPSQNTPLAILQRKLVRDTFEQEGLKVNRDKVEIVSNDYNQFEISDALMGKEYRLQFNYFQKEEYVTNLIVEYVRNRFEFGEQVIPRSGIQDFITEAVIERFKAGDTDPDQ